MIVAYAMGQGLGHLTRIRAAVHTMGVADDDVLLLTDSPHARDKRVVGGMQAESPPVGSFDRPPVLAAWVGSMLNEAGPDELWIDAFPAGIRGELDASLQPSATTVHLARLLQWSKYAERMPARPLRFDRTHLLEEIEDGHRATLDALSTTVSPLTLHEPASTADLLALATLEELPAPRWLIAHAGPEDELLELVAYAQDLADADGVSASLVVAAPNPIGGLPTIDTYPVWPLFEHVDRVITGAGFNSMRQAATLGLGDRHRFVPFPRRHDDQFERARRARATR